jgi:hypothetical protein
MLFVSAIKTGQASSRGPIRARRGLPHVVPLRDPRQAHNLYQAQAAHRRAPRLLVIGWMRPCSKALRNEPLTCEILTRPTEFGICNEWIPCPLSKGNSRNFFNWHISALYLVPLFSCFISYPGGRGTVYHYYLPVALTYACVRACEMVNVPHGHLVTAILTCANELRHVV